MTQDDSYNGWANYATWRVNLEIFSDYPLDSIDSEDDVYDLAEQCKEIAHNIVAEHGNGITLDYAEAFLADVNWFQIAKAMLESIAEDA